MRNLIIALSLLVTSAAQAAPALSGDTKAIATNPEVVSLVGAFEKHRGLRCDALDARNVRVRRSGAATALLSCNQYDENGDGMANVTQIELKGWVGEGSFDLSEVKFVPVE